MISSLVSNSALSTGLLVFSAHPHPRHALGVVLRVLWKGPFLGILQTGPMVCVQEPRFICPASDY